MTKKAAAPAPDPAAPVPQPAPDPFAHVGDEHWGKGGRYIVDPATGQRMPAPDEQETKE